MLLKLFSYFPLFFCVLTKSQHLSNGKSGLNIYVENVRTEFLDCRQQLELNPSMV